MLSEETSLKNTIQDVCSQCTSDLEKMLCYTKGMELKEALEKQQQANSDLTILTRRIQSLLPIVAMLMPEDKEFSNAANEVIKIKTF